MTCYGELDDLGVSDRSEDSKVVSLLEFCCDLDGIVSNEADIASWRNKELLSDGVVDNPGSWNSTNRVRLFVATVGALSERVLAKYHLIRTEDVREFFYGRHNDRSLVL